MLLWGLPELPYNGGKIRLNSVCGVNLNASNLYKAGVDDYHVIIQNTIDQNWIDAIRVIRALKGAHVGIAGFVRMASSTLACRTTSCSSIQG